jgi:hypothetical protein
VAIAAVAAALPPRDFVANHCLFVNTSGHCLRGELDYVTKTPEKIVQAFGASGKDTLVIYFHGGLVPADAAVQEIAFLDRNAFAAAGAYTLGIVWNSDAVTMAKVLSTEAGSAFADPVDIFEGVKLAPFVTRELAHPSSSASAMRRKLQDFAFRQSAGDRFLPWVQAVTSDPRPSSVDAPGSHRIRDFELTTGPLLTAMWNRMKRSTTLGCNANDANSVASRLLGTLAASPPKHIVLVAHSAGSVYVARFLLAARKLAPNIVFDVIFMAPALTYSEAAGDIEVFRTAIRHFRMFALSEPMERRNTVLNDLIDFSSYGVVGKWFSGFLSQTYPGSLLYYVSNALEGPADVPLLGLQRFIFVPRTYTAKEEADRKAVLDWLQPLENAAWSKGNAKDVDPRPGFQTAARKHGDFWFDPKTVGSLAYAIKDWARG